MSIETMLAPASLNLPELKAAPHVTRADVLAAYWELTKPRLVLLVLLTTAAGYWLGASGRAGAAVMLATIAGTALVAGGACVWNQVLEWRIDGLMRRTARRPLPAGRVRPLPSALFGSVLAASGVVVLSAIDGLAALVALATFVLYVAVYTPLKTRTTLNTAVGAVPGALPAVIGWAAATGRLGPEAWSLFLIVFLWQFPHFLAIAWIYREDYRHAGMRMLPGSDPRGVLTAGQAVLHAALLVPAGLLPVAVGLGGAVYAVGAVLCGLVYLGAALRFGRDVSDHTARRLLRASFLYLPAVLLLLVVSPWG